jgi:glucose/arabinose dehydrogenase
MTGLRMVNVFAVAGLLAGCLFQASPSKGGGQVSDAAATRTRRPSAAQVDVPAGYRIEALTRGLTFPTAVAIGDDGAVFVAESGYSYGELVTQPRILAIRRDGSIEREVTRGTHGPWNGLAFHDGSLYVSQGGAVEQSGRIVRVALDGVQTVIVDRLPTGDHHTNGPIVVDGWIYFAQGTVTNSGVVGVDSHEFGWLKRAPRAHDVPCRDVTLAGTNFTTRNPLSEADQEAVTGAFLPFGTPSKRGQTVAGALPCSGAVMKVRPDGSQLSLVAWGLRNPFGLAQGGGGVYVTDNGYDMRGSRPVFGAGDYLWKIEPDAWYGWPDFVGGEPITSKGFAEAGGAPAGFVLASHPGRPPAPLAHLPVHGSATGLDIARGDEFGHAGHAFIALFGDMAPNVGKVMAPVGFRVVRVDPRTGIQRDFARNAGDSSGPASKLGTQGLERPIAVRFDRAGEAMYIVDFGVLQMTGKGIEARPGTGSLWRITREDRHAAR